MSTFTHRFDTQRLNDNMRALNALISEPHNPELLRKFTGWGGLKEALMIPMVAKAITVIAGEKGYESSQLSCSSGFYTPRFLIEFMYEVVQHFYKGAIGSVLEPSAGRGDFLEYMPESLKSTAQLTCVEMDIISARFLKALYPKAHVFNTGFEQLPVKSVYDVVVGNPPFGQDTVQDRYCEDIQHHSICHYFVAKSFRLLKPCGILAMVVPRYFLDNPEKHVRTVLDRQNAHLLAAFRMPKDLFQDACVTVDIIFLKKVDSKTVCPWDWQKTSSFFNNKKRPYINEYFLKCPGHVLGNLKKIQAYGRTEIECERTQSNAQMVKTMRTLLRLPTQSNRKNRPYSNDPNLKNRSSQSVMKKFVKNLIRYY